MPVSADSLEEAIRTKLQGGVEHVVSAIGLWRTRRGFPSVGGPALTQTGVPVSFAASL